MCSKSCVKQHKTTLNESFGGNVQTIVWLISIVLARLYLGTVYFPRVTVYTVDESDTAAGPAGPRVGARHSQRHSQALQRCSSCKRPQLCRPRSAGTRRTPRYFGRCSQPARVKSRPGKNKSKPPIVQTNSCNAKVVVPVSLEFIKRSASPLLWRGIIVAARVVRLVPGGHHRGEEKPISSSRRSAHSGGNVWQLGWAFVEGVDPLHCYTAKHCQGDNGTMGVGEGRGGIWSNRLPKVFRRIDGSRNVTPRSLLLLVISSCSRISPFTVSNAAHRTRLFQPHLRCPRQNTSPTPQGLGHLSSAVLRKTALFRGSAGG